MKKLIILAGSFLTAQFAAASPTCFELGKQFALDAAADYCGISFISGYYEDQNCFVNPGKKDFEAGCENYIIDYVKDFYRDGYCKDKDKILQKKTREYIFKKQTCAV